MSRSATVRRMLLDIMREDREGQQERGRRVKLLLASCVLEGTLDPALNVRLISNPDNGFSKQAQDEVIVLIDVAIRPLSDPEVHVGLNELKLFMDTITGIIA